MPFWFTYSILHYQKYVIKTNVKKKISKNISKNELVLLKFSQKDTQTQLHWEHNKEFEYEGEMYDVVKSQTKGDSIWYWCWWDKAETQVKWQLNQLIAQNCHQNPQYQKNQFLLIHFVNGLFPLIFQNWQVVLFTSVHKILYMPYQQSIKMITSQPSVPPPQIIL